LDSSGGIAKAEAVFMKSSFMSLPGAAPRAKAHLKTRQRIPTQAQQVRKHTRSAATSERPRSLPQVLEATESCGRGNDAPETAIQELRR
jgi:hypothetical protein